MSAPDLVLVKFTASYGIWNAGEQAGFTPAMASALVPAFADLVETAAPVSKARGKRPDPAPAGEPTPDPAPDPAPAAEPVPAKEPEPVA